MFLRSVRCCPSSTPLLLATLTLFFYCCNPLFLRCSLSTCLLLVFVLLRDVVTTLLLKSLQWLPRLLDEDECYQLGVELSAQPAYITRLVSYLSRPHTFLSRHSGPYPNDFSSGHHRTLTHVIPPVLFFHFI